jgi:RNA polymerase sigma-70 factor (ECF subfamily)
MADLTQRTAAENGVGDQAAIRGLVARALHDPEAFAALYDIYVDRVHSYAYRRLRSKTEAEDVTAQTFLAALSNFSRFSWRGGGFGAWLFRIARNLCWDCLKRRARTIPYGADAAGSEVRLAAGGGVDETRDPEEALLADERLSSLRRLVQELPRAQNEVVLLKYAAGLGNREIAVTTGRSLTAVSSLLNRAREKLREGLAKDHG